MTVAARASIVGRAGNQHCDRSAAVLDCDRFTGRDAVAELPRPVSNFVEVDGKHERLVTLVDGAQPRHSASAAHDVEGIA